MDTHPVRVGRENILRQGVKGATPNFRLIMCNAKKITGGALITKNQLIIWRIKNG